MAVRFAVAIHVIAFTALWLTGVATTSAVPPSFTPADTAPPPSMPLGTGPFPAVNMTLLSHLTAEEMDPTILCSGEFCANDCWGYVSPSGREYAIVGLASSTAFVEITNPTVPTVIGVIPDNNSLWSDTKVYGHYAYNVNETGTNGDGIQVIDMAQIDSGIVNLVLEYHGPENILRAHTIAVNPDSGYLYAVGARTTGGAPLSNGGLLAYSLADPAAPVFAGAWGPRYVHESHVTTYTSGVYAGREIAFLFQGGAGLEIVDITNKGAMFSLSLTTYPGLRYCHQGWLSADKQVLYIDDELDESNGDTPVTRTLAFDVSDLSAPKLVNTFTTGLPAIDHNQYVYNELILQSNYSSGLHVFDNYENLIAPTHIASFDDYPEDDLTAYHGTWSNYPYLPSGNIIISDIERGLFVVRLDALRFRYPSGRPATVSPAVATVLPVHVDDYGSPVNPATALLHYSIDGGPESTPALTDLGGGDFTAALPAMDCNSVVEYYVSAENSLGTVYRDPAGAPAVMYHAAAASSTTNVFADDFESNNGWTASALTCGGTETGGWVRVDPNGTTMAPENDHSNVGTMCFVTAQGAPGGAPGDADVDGGPFRLTSPTIATNGQDALVSYARWLTCDDLDSTQDYLTVEMSIDGAPYAPVEVVSNGGSQWRVHEFRVSDLAVPGNTLAVRFSIGDCPSNSITEAAIDDFDVQLLECAPPPPIPTVSQWGTITLALLLTCAATLVFARRASRELQFARTSNPNRRLPFYGNLFIDHRDHQ